MARKKLTNQQKIEREYYKIRRNKEKHIQRLSEQGYEVQGSLPKVPKKITMSSITNLNRYSSTKTVDKSTGEVIIKTQRFQKQNTKGIKKKSAKEVIDPNVNEIRWKPEENKLKEDNISPNNENILSYVKHLVDDIPNKTLVWDRGQREHYQGIESSVFGEIFAENLELYGDEYLSYIADNIDELTEALTFEKDYYQGSELERKSSVGLKILNRNNNLTSAQLDKHNDFMDSMDSMEIPYDEE